MFWYGSSSIIVVDDDDNDDDDDDEEDLIGGILIIDNKDARTTRHCIPWVNSNRPNATHQCNGRQ